MLKHKGFSDTAMIGAYIFYNLVYAVFAYQTGVVADKIGLKKMFICGLIIFVITYLGMAISKDLLVMYLLFFLYGTYAACTEGVSKAWISNVCDKKDTATAIGTYEGFRSITTMLPSTLAGLIWFYASPEATFIITGIGVAMAVKLFYENTV